MSNQQTGLDSQTARLNSRPPQGDEIEDTRSALEKYQEWEKRIAKQLGVTDLRADVANDNSALASALKAIADSGAPEPIRVKNTVSYAPDPTRSFENEVLVFTHFQNPRLQYAAGEAWLALNPQIVITDLRALGIRKQ